MTRDEDYERTMAEAQNRAPRSKMTFEQEQDLQDRIQIKRVTKSWWRELLRMLWLS